MKLAIIDSSVRKMLGELDISKESFEQILRKAEIFDSIYDLKVEFSAEGLIWSFSTKDKKDFFQIIGVHKKYIKLKRNKKRNVVVSGRTLIVEKHTFFEISHRYNYSSLGLKITPDDLFSVHRNKSVIVCNSEFGKLHIDVDSNDFSECIIFENNNKRIFIDGDFTIPYFSGFVDDFLNIFNDNYEDITIVDVIRCLFCNSSSFNFEKGVNINIFNKITGYNENYIITNNGVQNLRTDDNRIITVRRAFNDDFINFSCKLNDDIVKVSFKSKSEICEDIKPSYVDFNVPLFNNMFNYLNELQFPVSFEEVYNKFLTFSREFNNMPYMMISIFNKNLGFSVEIYNGEVSKIFIETDRYVSEWHKDGIFKYAEREDGKNLFMVTIDNDMKVFYSGPVNEELLDSKVIDLNDILSYRAVSAARKEYCAIKKRLKEPFCGFGTK